MTVTSHAEVGTRDAIGAGSGRDRDWGIDAMRAVACLLVFLFHVDVGYGLAGGWLRGGGVAGVYTFFLLSGFLLYRPFLRGQGSLGGYALRRFARIYPAYLFVLIGLSLITRNPTFGQHPVQYLLFLQNFDPALFQGFAGVTWTLEMEVGFYIALPLIALAIRGQPTRLVLLAVCSFAAWLAVGTWGGSTPIVTLIPLYGWMFAAGMLLAIAVDRGWRPRSPAFAIAGVGLIAAELAISGPLGRADHALHYATMIGLTEAGALLIAAWLLNRTMPKWVVPLVVFGGALSYAFYLWHADVVAWIRGLAVHPAPATLIAFVLTLAIATISWLIVEKPAIELAKFGTTSWFRRQSRGPVVSVAGEEPGQA